MLMHRRKFAVGMMAIAMLGTVPHVSSGSDTIRIVHAFSSESRVHSELADLVPIMEAETDYSIRFEVYSAGELGVTDSLILGKFEGLYDFVLSPANLFAFRQQNVNFLARSDLFWSANSWKKFNGSEVETQVASLFEKDNLELMGSAWIGSEHLVARKPIAGVRDLQGIKMRVFANPVHVEAFKALGATPVPTGSSELYAALQTGAIDASVQQMHWKNMGHWIKGGGSIVRNPFGGHVAWLVGTPSWRTNVDAVTAELVKSALADSMVVLGTRIDDFEKAELEEYAGTGLAVAEWNSEDMKAVHDAVRNAVLEKLNPEERRIVEIVIDGL